MSKIIHPDKWIPCDGIILEDNANLAVREPQNILVVAGPGAGKTELLAQKASFLLQTNLCPDSQKILAISFKKDAAENLKERVKRRCGSEFGNRFASMTYDAFAKSLLDHFRYALPEEYRPNSDYIIGDDTVIDLAFRQADYNNPYNLSPSKLRAAYDLMISKVQIPYANDGLGEKVWSSLLKGFNGNPACLTFKMISVLAEYIVRTNVKIRRALLCTYSHVFLDEFQDTTNMQYNLIKSCFESTDASITAVGDNKQRIMGWAGARITVFDDFQKEFCAQKTQLIMNHRSAPGLVELQRLMYESLQEESVRIKHSEKWNDQDGEIKLIVTDSETAEADIIADDIRGKISEGIHPRDICILCKQTPDVYTNNIINKLNEYGIRARVETDYQDLLREPVVALLVSFLRLSIERRRPDEWEDVNESLQYIYGISDIDNPNEYEKKQEELINCLNVCRDKITAITSDKELKLLIEKIMQFWDIPKIKAAYPAYMQGNYFEEIINKFIRLLWDEHEQCRDNWVNTLENFMGEKSIPIMTIHKSKGLEYETVWFVGLEDGAFWNFRNQPMEDRCVFFVALSRAKKYVNFTFCNNRQSLKYPKQSRKEINEFFQLLTTPGVAEVIKRIHDIK